MSSDQWTCFDPDQPSGWDEQEFSNFVDHRDWRVARTMPENPHEYTLRKDALQPTFDSAVRYVREHGCLERFGGKPYKVLYFRDHKYWTMGASLPATILINRKPRLADSSSSVHLAG